MFVLMIFAFAAIVAISGIDFEKLKKFVDED